MFCGRYVVEARSGEFVVQVIDWRRFWTLWRIMVAQYATKSSLSEQGNSNGRPIDALLRSKTFHEFRVSQRMINTTRRTPRLTHLTHLAQKIPISRERYRPCRYLSWSQCKFRLVQACLKMVIVRFRSSQGTRLASSIYQWYHS